MAYAELLCLSNFTFQHGASHPFELIQRAKALGYSALALTDECSLAGIVRAHDVAQDHDFKLIIGSVFRLREGDRIVLLAPTGEAYAQLCELITMARRSAAKGSYTIDRSDFASSVEHCIGLWMPAPKIELQHAEWFVALPLTYRAFAFSHVLAQNSRGRLDQLRLLSQQLSVPIAAVGDVHYHIRARRPLHDVLTAVRLKTTVEAIGRRGFSNGERHLRPLDTLAKLYPQDLLAETTKIADRCDFSLKELSYHYPEELVPAGMTATQHLRVLTEEGLKRRWPLGEPADVRALIEKELVLIHELRFEHYFLTVEEIVRFARGAGIICQGRGSAANSAVCYALGITEVDPARVSMLFERFLSKERHEPPDIDVDFEHYRREEVIQHIYQKYGRHRAALAATVITYRHRLAVRDVGKALGFPPDIVDALAKSLHWFAGGCELSSQLTQLGFDPQSSLAQRLLVLVNELLGFPRHLSQHVGGFVISQPPLSTLVPVENASMPDRTIIQWDKTDLESLGLLKIDCLALGMLTALHKALDLKSEFDGKPFRLQDIPSEDPATYDMLCKAESVGVFQIESRAQMTMLPRLQPRTYFDLVAQIAIIRPGPIQGGMVHPFLRRRQGLEPVTYPSPQIERILKCTYGVPLFQEQVMQIAIVAGGFSAGEADQVRRSMAAWQRRGGLQQFRDKLRAGMIERGYTEGFCEQLYQQILGFGSYGFPMSHAASFALIAYATAWMRCHEPAAFVAGLLNAWPMGFYAPAQLVNDAGRNGVCFRPVDVSKSAWESTLERTDDGRPEVRLGFRLVSGLSEAQCLQLIDARRTAPFASVSDVAHRALLNRRSVHLLARAGALQSIASHRRAAHWAALGVEHLPGLLAGHSAQEDPIALRPPTEGQNIVYDYRSMGLTLGRHPLSLLRERLQQLRVTRNADLHQLNPGRRVRVAGIVTCRQRPETASGVIFITLEDETGMGNIIVWKRIQMEQPIPVFEARMLIVEGEVQKDAGIHVVARTMKDYSSWLGQLDTSSRDFH